MPGNPPPTRRRCGTMQVHYRLLEQHPEFRARQAALEARVLGRFGAKALALPKIVTVPVVVHVLHRTPAEKLSAAQVRSQITALNKDFRATNPDRAKVPEVWRGLVTDARVQFALAKKDPAGKSSAGILFVATDVQAFYD